MCVFFSGFILMIKLFSAGGSKIIVGIIVMIVTLSFAIIAIVDGLLLVKVREKQDHRIEDKKSQGQKFCVYLRLGTCQQTNRFFQKIRPDYSCDEKRSRNFVQHSFQFKFSIYNFSLSISWKSIFRIISPKKHLVLRKCHHNRQNK